MLSQKLQTSLITISHQLATTHNDTTFIDNLAAMKRVPQTHCINCASSKHSAGAVTITMNQSPEKISGPSLLTLSSLLHPTAAVECGSARGKAAMLRSLLRKDGTSFIGVRQIWAKRLTGLRQTEVIILLLSICCRQISGYCLSKIMAS